LFDAAPNGDGGSEVTSPSLPEEGRKKGKVNGEGERFIYPLRSADPELLIAAPSPHWQTNRPRGDLLIPFSFVMTESFSPAAEVIWLLLAGSLSACPHLVFLVILPDDVVESLTS
jgi:hypothetical protein